MIERRRISKSADLHISSDDVFIGSRATGEISNSQLPSYLPLLGVNKSELEVIKKCTTIFNSRVHIHTARGNAISAADIIIKNTLAFAFEHHYTGVRI